MKHKKVTLLRKSFGGLKKTMPENISYGHAGQTLWSFPLKIFPTCFILRRPHIQTAPKEIFYFQFTEEKLGQGCVLSPPFPLQTMERRCLSRACCRTGLADKWGSTALISHSIFQTWFWLRSFQKGNAFCIVRIALFSKSVLRRLFLPMIFALFKSFFVGNILNTPSLVPLREVTRRR